MRTSAAVLAAIALCVICSTVCAMYDVAYRGTWPKSWPQELEPLRERSRTLTGPMLPRPHYEIPFTRRADFESAWPHILRVKSKGAPVILVHGPDARLGTKMNAGVRIHAPPPQGGNRAMPEAPLPGPVRDANVRERWMYTTFIELIVDGNVVDLNRFPLPPDTVIIDERFTNRPKR